MTPVFQGIQHRKNTQSKYVNKTETKQKQRQVCQRQTGMVQIKLQCLSILINWSLWRGNFGNGGVC